MKNKKKLLLGLIPVIAISILLCNKPISRIINVESKTYGTPANSAFTDENFYKCVINAYNNKNNASLGYDVSLTDEQLATITSINCSGHNKEDVDVVRSTNGLNKLVNITNLDLFDNQITSIDLSHNPSLTSLNLVGNQLTNVDLSHNIALETLLLDSNQLLNIDTSYNTALKNLSLSYNLLTSIDLRYNTLLTSLDLHQNQLTNIDLSHNRLLTHLYLYSNKLTNIDLNNNILLETLNLDDNQLVNIDISHNTTLKNLSLSNNLLTSINLSYNTALELVNLDGNQLTNIDLSQNMNLTYLDLANNQLTGIDLSHNATLKKLELNENEINSIDLSQNINLKSLNLEKNQIAEINISHNPLLTYLNLGYNEFTNIDLSNNVELEELYLIDSKLTNIDLTKNIKLEVLHLESYHFNLSATESIKISELDVSKNVNLRSLFLKDNDLSNIDVSNNPLLQDFGLENNKLSEVDLSNNTNLSLVWLDGNNIKKIKCNSVSCPVVIGRQYKLFYIYENDFSNINDEELLELVNKNGNDKAKYQTEFEYVDADGSVKKYDFTYDVYRVSISSEKFIIDENNNYIYTGTDIADRAINNNIKLIYDDSVVLASKFMSSIKNNKYIITNAYSSHADFYAVKEFDLVNISSDKYDLSKQYLTGDLADITNNINVTNGTIVFNLVKNSFQIKHNDDVLQEFNYVNYTSDKYDLSKDYIKVNDNNIELLLNNINCTNCNAYVYDGTNTLTTGEFKDNYKLRIMHNDDIIKEYEIKYAVSGVELNTNNIKLNLEKNKTYNLIANITPTNAENKNVTWESSNPSVATVDENGLVTAKGIGNATITVKTIDGEFIDTCNVVVSEIIIYTVTFKDKDNTYTSEFEEGENIIFKSDLEKKGYKLIGWKYNNQNYSLTDKLPMPSNNIELTSIWELVIPEIKNYTTNQENITGISLKTDINNMNLGIDSMYDVKIKKHDGTDKTSGLVSTGDKIKIYLDNELVSEYDVIIKGDVTGTGTSSVSDVAKLYQYLKGKITIDECYIKAGNVVDSDSTIKVNDVAKLYQFIKGKISNL